MRRYFVMILLAALLSQSSGIAIAGVGGPLPTSITLSSLVAPFHALVGLIGGYGATHVAPMVVERPQHSVNAAELIRGEHPLRPVIRHGIPHAVELPPRSALDPRHRVLDPLAMRPSTIRRVPSPPLPSTMLRPESPQTIASPDVLAPLHIISAITPTQGKHRLGAAQRGGRINPMASSTPTTGIEHWWTYEERAIPGIGKAMLNVGTGNLVVSAMDVDVPEQGIDLAFQRVYNSQSLHDVNGDDGGEPAIYGNLWTNTFDANIVYNSAAITITVYDIDGTACTYTSDGKGNWIPCTGEYATLQPVSGSSDCLYQWTKKNGTQYVFHTDATGSGCTIANAKHGRLQQINARNSTNNITFTYSYNGQGQTAEDITQIVATHSDGQTLTLNFGLIAGTYNELASITLPDGNAELQYSYDNKGNLLEVDKPGNNSASLVPKGHGVPSGDAPETYAYVTGSSTMKEACGPRCSVSAWNNTADGSALLFSFNSGLLANWMVQGVLNFTPPDGTNTKLQPAYTQNSQTWYTAYFVYGQSQTCPLSESGQTITMCDTDGHDTTWTLDSTARVTQTQEYTGAGEGSLMTTSQEGWDGNNDLISVIDANGNTTLYDYDTPGATNQGGNVVEVLQPLVTDIYGTNVKPLATYGYDKYNNVIAYCDPDYNQRNGITWQGNHSDNLCPQGGNAYAAFVFETTTNEGYGCLKTMKTPMTYQTDIKYTNAGTDDCGNGLPKTVYADAAITQFEGLSRTPTQDFTYDQYGNLTGYDRGAGLDSWTLGYDSDNGNGDNRNEWKTQNDTVIPNAAITSFTCYYPDGSLFYTETPSQHAQDKQSCPSIETLLQNPGDGPPTYATSYQYDLDGDQTEVITHKGCFTPRESCSQISQTVCNTATQTQNPQGTTCKYYDGLDRLVETAEPYDTGRTMENNAGTGTVPYEFYTFRWMNRYIYDLSQSTCGAQLQISDLTGSTVQFRGCGNLYKTQEFLPQAQSNMRASLTDGNNGQYSGNPGWSDVRGTSFDSMDRPLNKFELAYGTAAVTKNTYDCSGALDLLCSTTNAVGQTTSYNYDAVNHVQSVSFSGQTPQADNRTYQYDPDGRTMTIESVFGTLTYGYDYDGNKTSVAEPSNNPYYTAPSLICYSYYPDGLREYVSIGPVTDGNCGAIKQQTISGAISQPQIFSYAYTEDGLLDDELVNWNGNGGRFKRTYYPSDREDTETDPVTGQQVNKNYPQFVAKSYMYDPSGRVQTLELPETFEESALTYDDDDELAGYQTSYNGASGATRNFVLNDRGELLQDYATNDSGLSYAQGATQSANGTQLGEGNCQSSCGSATINAPPSTETFDVRSGMAIYGENPLFPSAPQGQGSYGFAYDAAGRQTGATQYPYFPPSTASPSPAYTTMYDSENHVTQTSNTQDLNPPFSKSQLTYSQAAVDHWGPDGHQSLMSLTPVGGTAFRESTHWDGDTLLFESSDTNGNGTILYIGKLGLMDSNGDITVVDRDQTGTQLSMHGSSSSGYWFSPWSYAAARNINVYGKYGGSITFPDLFSGSCGEKNQSLCPGPFPTFSMSRSDGYAMVGGNVQGARTFDPVSGQWLTPDPFAGDVRDPMSQKPFMWNGNNPVEWSDPSGYCSSDPESAKNDPCLSSGLGLEHGQRMKEATNTLESIGKFALSLAVPGGAEEGTFAEMAEFFGGGLAKISSGLAGLGVRAIDVAERGISDFGTNAAHSFPAVFDAEIFEHGETLVQKDGFVTQRLAGELNGNRGWYEISGKIENGVFKIEHRSFTRADRAKKAVQL